MSLQIWISSFIPKNVSGLTRPVPGHDGKTMFPGPTILNDCFHTDQRSFSADPTANARMRSLVEIAVPALTLAGQSHHCDLTHECDCEDGSEECSKQASSSRMKVDNFQSDAAHCSFSLIGAAGNPCFTGAPDINWEIHVKVEKSAGNKYLITVTNNSLVEPFPAFEMYARLDGQTKPLFQIGPKPGATPGDLFGDPNRSVSGTAIL